MRSPFDDRLAVADDVVDGMNAEPFVLHPQGRSANGRAVPDPDQPAVKGQGIFELRDIPIGVQLGNRRNTEGSNDLRTLRSSPTPTLSVSEAVSKSTELRQGDRVALPNRGTGKRFEVVSVQPDGQGRVTIELIAT